MRTWVWFLLTEHYGCWGSFSSSAHLETFRVSVYIWSWSILSLSSCFSIVTFSKDAERDQSATLFSLFFPHIAFIHRVTRLLTPHKGWIRRIKCICLDKFFKQSHHATSGVFSDCRFYSSGGPVLGNAKATRGQVPQHSQSNTGSPDGSWRAPVPSPWWKFESPFSDYLWRNQQHRTGGGVHL